MRRRMKMKMMTMKAVAGVAHQSCLVSIIRL